MKTLKLERRELPQDIKNEMRLWRNGWGGSLTPYIDFHKTMAEETLELFKTNGITVHNTWMARDGWGDGMRVLWAVIEYKENLFKIRWNDGNQEFFKQSKSGGSYPLNLEEAC